MKRSDLEKAELELQCIQKKLEEIVTQGKEKKSILRSQVSCTMLLSKVKIVRPAVLRKSQ